MNPFRPASATALILTIAMLQACSKPEESATALEHAPSEPSAKPVVFVPIPPYEFIFERIAGDLIDLRVIVGPDDDPHSYSPSPKQVVEMAKADLLCSGGLGFEGNYFIKTGDNGNEPGHLNLLENLQLLEGHCDHPSHQTETTEDDHDHDHAHDDLNDPHVWLSPTALQAQIDFIAAEVKKLLPADQSSRIDTNVTTFKKELTDLHADLEKALKPHNGMNFYVYHGAFAYFAQDFGLHQIAVEVGNRSPSPRELTALVEKAKAENVKLIFTQPQFDPASANTLAEAIGGKIAFLDPLKKDIFTNLHSIAAAIADSGR